MMLHMDLRDSVIKAAVANFIFFAASAPARIISANLDFHGS
jgi:hypothetical protein